MNIEALKGLTLTKIDKSDLEIIFHEKSGRKFQMFHDQGCCECVYVEDVCGDLDDLIGSPILNASEETSCENPPDVKKKEYQDSFTWTFYKISTIKGSVTIRWYGESNGYYSEEVEFRELR